MSDPRFARLKTDPRFRRPKKHNSKVLVDERFKSVFTEIQGNRKGTSSGRVDKYGRPISDTHEQDDLRRFYRLQTADAAGGSGDEDDGQPAPRPDFARGGVLLESSDEDEDEDGQANDEKARSSDDEDRLLITGKHSSKLRPIAKDDVEPEIDLDEDTFADLDAQAAAFQHEIEDEDERDTTETRTRRLAVVNLDWDHVRAGHLYKICASLVSLTAPLLASSSMSNGKKDKAKDRGDRTPASGASVVRGAVLSVVVYPSDFGKERMEREEREGPPAEIFRRGGVKEVDDDDVNALNVYDVAGQEEYDEDALRRYQLERLRYYYAVITCDTVDAASHIYNELEGTELERSANVFDLSFVPDDMTFDNEPRDEATDDQPTSYKSIDFVTDALRHSKVKLTWDGDDHERAQVTRRTLTKQQIEEADFKAYLASSSDSELSSDDNDGTSQLKNKPKESKKASRDRMRALLLGGNDDAMPEGWGDDAAGGERDVDMEITFTPGLSMHAGDGEEDETTLDRYQKKMREKRRKRKEEVREQARAKEEVEGDDFFEAGSDGEGSREEGSEGKKLDKKRRAKDGKGNKRKGDGDDAARPKSTPEELALLVASDNPNAEPQHFNLKSVLKAEKKRGKKAWKGKHGKGDEAADREIQEDFVIDVKDERFKVLHEDHQFAIDPSNPHFKKTKSMAALLEERQKRQRSTRGDGEDVPVRDSAGLSRGTGEKSLKSLVESVKRKSISVEHGPGKRRKL